MVSSPDDANIPDLGSVSTNLGELSTDDAMTSWGWGAACQPIFKRLEFPKND
jgi:hypothetical protein